MNAVAVIMLLMLIVVLAVNFILGFYRGRMIQAGDPLAFYISCSFVVVCLLYTWKDKFEFIKQGILAAPFALLLAVVFKLFGFKMIFSMCAGVALFLLLLTKAENRNQHFIITLTTSVIFTGFITAYKLLGWNLYNMNIYKIYITFGCPLPLLFFYSAYLVTLNSNPPPEFRPLLLKSIKLAGATFLLLVLFTISQELCKHYQISFVISLMISVLLSLCFLGLCYKFKLSLNDLTQEKSKESKNKELLNNLKKEVKGS